MLNKVTLIGNVGGDPEIKITNSGSKIATFSLATSEFWKDKTSGERKDQTQWHSIVVFNPHLIPVIEAYVKKGSKLYLEGQLKTSKYTDKDGVERWNTKVELGLFKAELKLLDSKNDSNNSSSFNTSKTYNQSFASSNPQPINPPEVDNLNKDLDDEIPF